MNKIKDDMKKVIKARNDLLSIAQYSENKIVKLICRSSAGLLFDLYELLYQSQFDKEIDHE